MGKFSIRAENTHLSCLRCARLGRTFKETFFVEMSTEAILDGGYAAGMNSPGTERREEERDDDNGQVGADLSRGRRRISAEIAEIDERPINIIGQVLSCISAPSVHNIVSTSTAPPVNGIISAWSENQFSILLTPQYRRTSALKRSPTPTHSLKLRSHGIKRN